MKKGGRMYNKGDWKGMENGKGRRKKRKGERKAEWKGRGRERGSNKLCPMRRDAR